ncbi:MAG: aldehyde dehydrogenase family protein, partial [Actinomycetota bacterium]|nr:aldehyde dehydrogenase family protein [Actinomycetota bacterium]
MQDFAKLYIDGAWVAPESNETIEVVNASTEAVMGSVPAGTPADVDKAVAAARGAFDGWAATSPPDRAKYVQALSEGIGARNQELAETITGEVGMPIFLSQLVQAGLPQAIAGSYSAIVDEFVWEEEVGNSLVVKEPIGVVGAITPWNYPLHQIVAKVAPALAAGCTIVLKPSEVAPLNAFMLAEIIDGIGLPPGVFNLVSGTGPVVGEAIAGHPDVDMVSFTGSTRAGTRVAELGAPTVKRVALELGGKSANILLPDLDGEELDKAARAAVGSAYLNSGQTCTAFTRLLVPADKHDQIVDILVDEV